MDINSQKDRRVDGGMDGWMEERRGKRGLRTYSGQEHRLRSQALCTSASFSVYFFLIPLTSFVREQYAALQSLSLKTEFKKRELITRMNPMEAIEILTCYSCYEHRIK